jgi:hypothetical protein
MLSSSTFRQRVSPRFGRSATFTTQTWQRAGWTSSVRRPQFCSLRIAPGKLPDLRKSDRSACAPVHSLVGFPWHDLCSILRGCHAAVAGPENTRYATAHSRGHADRPDQRDRVAIFAASPIRPNAPLRRLSQRVWCPTKPLPALAPAFPAMCHLERSRSAGIQGVGRQSPAGMQCGRIRDFLDDVLQIGRRSTWATTTDCLPSHPVDLRCEGSGFRPANVVWSHTERARER